MRALTCMFILLSLLMASGVYATWDYYSNTLPKSNDLSVRINEFAWAPEEVLPDDEEATENDINHMAILDEILFNSKMGLNMRIGAIDSPVEKNTTSHYGETIQGGNLKHLIDASEGGRNLGFVLEYVNEESFYGYSFYRINQENGSYIQAFKTLYAINTDPKLDVNNDKKTDLWCAVSSQRGYAMVIKGIKHMEMALPT